MNKLKWLSRKKPKSSLDPKNKLLHRNSYHVESPEKEFHHSKLGVHAFNLWKKDLFTDVSIKCLGKVYHAHRPVLSCYSTYFKKHNPNKDNNTIKLDGLLIKPETFEILLRYMYTGDLDITVQTIGDIYIASRKLGIKKALNLCTEILTGEVKRDLQCIYIYTTAKKLKEKDAVRRSLQLMGRHFEQIIGTTEFLDLSFAEIMEYLSYEHLNIRSEMVVFLAALKWLNHKPLERQAYVERVISCVRFPEMALNEVLACFSPPLLPGIIRKPVVEYMLLKATCFIASKTVNEEKRFKRYSCKPRTRSVQQVPLLLWDPNIFDPIRYSHYKKEEAATTIQSAYRAHLARREKRRLQFLRDTKMSKNSDKINLGKTIQKEIKNDIRKKPSKTMRLLNQELLTRINRVVKPSMNGNDCPFNVQPADANFKYYTKSPIKKNYTKGQTIKKVGEEADISEESIRRENNYMTKIKPSESNQIVRTLSIERNSQIKVPPGEIPVTEHILSSEKINIDKLLMSDTSLPAKELSSKTSLTVRKSYINTGHTSREAIHIIKNSPSKQSSGSAVTSQSNTSESVSSKTSLTLYGSPSQTSRKVKKKQNEVSLKALYSDASVSPYKTAGLFEQKPFEKYDTDQTLCSKEFKEKNASVDIINDFMEASTTDKKSANKVMKEIDKKGIKQFNTKSSMEEQIKEAGMINQEIETRIILIGGYDPDNLDNKSIGERMIGYNPETDEWTNFGTMPVSRHNMCAVYCNASIYIIGGSNVNNLLTTGVRPTDDCRKFHLQMKNWVKINSMCSPRMYHGAGVVNDIIYVVGGVDDKNNILNTIEWYNVSENEWQMLKCKLRVPKMAIGVCGYRGNLWIAGGMSDNNLEEKILLFKDVEVYDPGRNEMQKNIADLPSPRTYTSLVECNKSIYCVGGAIIVKGRKEKISSLSEVYVYADHMNVWTPSISLPLPGHSMSVISCGGLIYAINGLSTSVHDMLSECIWVFDTKSNDWTSRTPLSSVNDGICVVSIPADLFDVARK